MHVRIKAILVLFIAFWGIASAGFAQHSNDRAGAFLRYGASARAMAMGGAFTAIANDASATYWNPAGLRQMHRIHFMASYIRLPFDRTFNFVSGVLPIGSQQAIGISWLGLQVAGLEARSNNTLNPDFIFSNSENALYLSYSYRLLPALYLGSSVKLLYSSLAGRQGVGASFDASLLIQPLENLSVGILARDLASTLRWAGDYRESLARALRIGVSYQWLESLVVSVDVAQNAGESISMAFGAEFNPLNDLPLRLGFGPQGISTGAGFRVPMNNLTFALNYGYNRDALLGAPIHQLSLQISFFKASRAKPATRSRSTRPARRYSASSRSVVSLVRITATILNVRYGPGTNFRVLTKVRKGQNFIVLDEAGTWIKIRLASGQAGWVHKNYVRKFTRSRK